MTAPAPISPRLFIETPRRLVPPKYGLLSAATIVPGEDRHFLLDGVEYWLPVDPKAVGGTELDEWCSGEDFAERTIEGGLPAGTGKPFQVYATSRCKLVGTTRDELRQRAIDTLQSGVSQFVERRLWQDGDPAIMPDAVEVTSAAVSLSQAVGLLEAFLYAEYASVGVIHLPRWLGAEADRLDVIRPEGNVMRTALGTPVVFGDYPGTGPGAVTPDAGEVWIAATGDVQVWRTSPDVLTDRSQSWFDPTTNVATSIVTSDYLVTFDETAAAALVQLEGV